MRLSSVVLSTVLVGVVACVSGCRVSVDTKQRFAVSSGPSTVQEDTQDWTGESISVNVKGVGVAVNGGVTVVADPNVTKVTATTRFLAMAFEKPDADASIEDAEKTFLITRSGEGPTGTITVACDHGGTHGSSDSGSSGCEFVEVHVPVGSATTPLAGQFLSGNGTLTLNLSEATIGAIGANSNGGDINASLPANKGGSASLVASKADDIYVSLPPDFSADEVILQADADKIVLGPYTDVKNGAGAGGRGTAGVGLTSLKVTSQEFAGSTGTITLR
jgi:hypothetical protein